MFGDTACICRAPPTFRFSRTTYPSQQMEMHHSQACVTETQGGSDVREACSNSCSKERKSALDFPMLEPPSR